MRKVWNLLFSLLYSAFKIAFSSAGAGGLVAQTQTEIRSKIGETHCKRSDFSNTPAINIVWIASVSNKPTGVKNWALPPRKQNGNRQGRQKRRAAPYHHSYRDRDFWCHCCPRLVNTAALMTNARRGTPGAAVSHSGSTLSFEENKTMETSPPRTFDHERGFVAVVKDIACSQQWLGRNTSRCIAKG